MNELITIRNLHIKRNHRDVLRVARWTAAKRWRWSVPMGREKARSCWRWRICSNLPAVK